MEKNKVTTEALREMQVGETIVFALPDASAINTGKAIAYRARHVLRCRFRAASDFVNNTLTLTKLPYDAKGN
ncbi:MAG: hypothetical protein NC403_08815 [Muribaculaceae bacterium]|nr:hypothetical protein [Muribaculaceae bacterium]